MVVGLVKNQPVKQKTRLWFLGWEDPWRRNRLTTLIFLGFPHGSDGEESACNVGDLGSIPGLGRSPGERSSNPLQYSCLENSMEGRAWWATIHESCSMESNMTKWFHFHFHNAFTANHHFSYISGLSNSHPTFQFHNFHFYFHCTQFRSSNTFKFFFFFSFLAQIVKTNTFLFGMTGHAKN